jgi:hypothetical protein
LVFEHKSKKSTFDNNQLGQVYYTIIIETNEIDNTLTYESNLPSSKRKWGLQV